MVRNGLRTKALLCVYPALRTLPLAEWDEIVRRARDAEFDVIERIAILVGTCFVAYLLRFETDPPVPLSLPARYLVQFLAAVPLIVLIAGPAYLRRTRRGIDREIELRNLAGDVDS